MAADLVERMRFFGRIVREGKFYAATLAVAFALLFRFYNGKTARCDPGQTALAREAGISERHVRRAANKLAAAGWFRVQIGGGSMTRHGPTTAYFPQFDHHAHGIQGGTSVSGVASPKGGQPRLRSALSSEDMLDLQGGTALSARTSKRTSDTDALAKGEAAEQFDSFWQAYPKRQGSNPKKPAAAKFESLVRRGADPAAIIRGAQNYAADMIATGKAGTQYVCQAVTWLNQERWSDCQEPQKAEESRLRAGLC